MNNRLYLVIFYLQFDILINKRTQENSREFVLQSALKIIEYIILKIRKSS
jgi:hypothetical protein